MPSAPSSASSRESAITSAVLYPPAPARTGTLPLASSTAICTTRRCSSRVSVGLSPVVPHGTRKSMPASTCRLTKACSVASSSAPSPRNGVTSAVPVPVNMVFLLFYPDVLLPKFKLGGRQAASLEIYQPNSLRISLNSKKPFFPAIHRAACTEADRPLVTCCKHFFGKFFERPRRRVLFLGVMNLPSPCFVFGMFGKERRRMGDSLNEKIHSHGKIRRPYQTRLTLLDRFARGRKLIEPAGGADDGVDAQHRKAADIFRRRLRRREINRHVNAAQRFMRQRLGMRVVMAVEFRAHFKSMCRRELLDEPAHLSATDNGEAEAHAPLRPVARSCPAMRA